MNLFEKIVSGCSDVSIFTPAPYDMSLVFLRMIFGSVGDALYGVSNPLVSMLFQVFNTGILLITSSMIGYSVFLGVIGASQDGSAMGGQSKGILNPWVMSRVVFGSSMLIPSFSGYSAMQVLVMFTTVQGVGLADTLWNTALDYLSVNGMISSPASVNYKDQNLKKLVDAGGMIDSLYASILCMRHNIDKAVDGGFYDSQKDDLVILYNVSPDKVNVIFPSSCGSYEFNVGGILSQAQRNDLVFSTRVSSFFKGAMQRVISSLSSSANATLSMAEMIVKNDTTQSIKEIESNLKSSIYCNSIQCAAAGSYLNAATIYLDTVEYVYKLVNPSKVLNNVDRSWFASAKEKGWIAAGMYFFDITNNYLSGNATSPSGDVPDLTISSSPYFFYKKTSGYFSSEANDSDFNYLLNAVNKDKLAYKYSKKPIDCGGSQCSIYSNSSSFPCNSCQAYSLVNHFYNTKNIISTSALESVGQATDMDRMYAKVLRNILILLRQIDTYPYMSLTPKGVGAFAAIDDCTMVMPIARFYRYVLGGAARVLIGFNMSFWDGQMHCGGFWTGPSRGDFVDMLRKGNSTNNDTCVDLANNCIGSSSADDILRKCNMSVFYTACMDGQYGFFPYLYAASKGRYMDPIYATTRMGINLMFLAITYWKGVMADTFGAIMSSSWALFGASMPLQLAGDIAAAAMYGWAAAVPGVIYATMQLAINITRIFFELSKSVLEMYLPLGASLAAIVFGLGVAMGIYVPFMPFMLYLFGVIGWLMAIVEAMIAAPLVALGITHPEGHDLLGKSEQAVMLLLGVFVRPATMLLGLLFAINVSQISVQLLDYGFLYVFEDISGISNGSNDAITNGFVFLGAMVVYVYILMTIIDQAYSLVYQVPDKILRWIGGPQDNSASAQMAQQVKGQVQQIGGKAGDAASSTSGRAPGISGQVMTSTRGKIKGKENTSISATKADS